MPADAPVMTATGLVSGMSRPRELGDDLLGDGLGFYLLRVGGLACGPDASVEAFDAECAVERDAMLHVEARPAEFHDLGLDHHVVAELSRFEELRTRVDHRVALDFVVSGELVFGHA